MVFLRAIQVIGHRGCGVGLLENTVRGVREALRVGVDAVECDVKVTRDGELVVIHDFTVDRMTNGRGSVSRFSLEELKELEVGQGEKIPTLQEIIDVIKGAPDVMLHLDMHVFHCEGQVVDIVRRNGVREQVLFTSGVFEMLETVRVLDGEMMTQLSYGYPLEDPVSTAQKLNVNVVNPQFRFLSKELVDECHEVELRINTWVLNTVKDMRQAIRWEVDGIATDHPQLLQKVLREAK